MQPSIRKPWMLWLKKNTQQYKTMAMEKLVLPATLLFLSLLLASPLPSLACPYCRQPTPPKKPPPPPPKLCPPPPPPKPKPCPPPPVYSPPPPPPATPSTVPCPPPPPTPATCPIDTLKLDACVNLLGGLIHIGVGSASDTCCPVLGGLVDLDAAVCLCTTIKAKLLNINVVLPVALEILVSCGKHAPPGFKCPA